MTITDIKAEILFAVLAGSSVPPANLWSMIFLISGDAKIKHKLYEELISAEKGGRIPPTTCIISEEQAKQLPYLHACVHESLRYAQLSPSYLASRQERLASSSAVGTYPQDTQSPQARGGARRFTGLMRTCTGRRDGWKPRPLNSGNGIRSRFTLETVGGSARQKALPLCRCIKR